MLGFHLGEGELKELFTRNFVVVTITNFLVMISYYEIFVTSALYAQERFKIPLSEAGLTLGMMVIGCLFGRFMSGNIISNVGGLKVLLAGTLTYSLLALANLFIPSLGLLYLQRFLAGLAMGTVLTATGSIMAFIVPPKMQGLGVSIFSLSTALALALGPFIGLTVVQTLGYSIMLYESLSLALLSFVTACMLKNAPSLPSRARRWLSLDSYVDKRVFNIGLIALLMPLGYGCISAFLASYSQERGLEIAGSLFFLVSAAVTIISRPIAGRFFDRFGENIVIYPAIILAAAALLILADATTAAEIVLAGILQGLGFGNFQSAGQALSLKLVPRERFPQATSTFFICFDLGLGLSPYIFGTIAVHQGFGAMFLTLSVITLATVVFYYLLHGRSHPLKMPLFKKRIKRTR